MFWSLYFWLFAIVIVGSAIGRVALYFIKPGSVSVRDVLFSLPGCACVVALHAYIHQMPLGPSLLWITLACALPVLYWIEMRDKKALGAMQKLGRSKAIVIFGATFLFTLPGYIALVLHAARWISFAN